MIDLDDKGWGLNTMIILVCVLIFVVLLVFILAYQIDKEGETNPAFHNHKSISLYY